MRTKEEVTMELMATIDKANHLRLELVAIEYGLEGFDTPTVEEAEQAAAFLPPARPMGVRHYEDALTPAEQRVVDRLNRQIADALASRSVAERVHLAVHALTPRVA